MQYSSENHEIVNNLASVYMITLFVKKNICNVQLPYTECTHIEIWKVLFLNDFVRKGGDFILLHEYIAHR